MENRISKRQREFRNGAEVVVEQGDDIVRGSNRRGNRKITYRTVRFVGTVRDGRKLYMEAGDIDPKFNVFDDFNGSKLPEGYFTGKRKLMNGDVHIGYEWYEGNEYKTFMLSELETTVAGEQTGGRRS